MKVPSPLSNIPAERSARWALLGDIISQWYPPLQSGDGIPSEDMDTAESRLGVALPKALREWYGLAGSRKDIWSRQDDFRHPRKLTLEREHLVFIIENQDVVEWGIRRADLGLDDPPVYVSSVDDRAVWQRENSTVSEFALQMFATCLKWSNTCRWWANGCVKPEVVERLAAEYPRLPFPEWHWPTNAHIHGLQDTLAHVEFMTDHNWLYVLTRTEAAAKAFKEIFESYKIEWTASSDEWPPGWVSAADDLNG